MGLVSRAQLNDCESKLIALKTKYLEEHGWTYTCKTPGSTWLWRKVYMDDAYMCNMPMALVVEEALSAA